MSTDTKKVGECHYMAIDTEAGYGDSGQMASAPSLSWLNNFPGDISARGVIRVWWAFDCHSGGRSKAQLTASSSLVCLLWTPATPAPSPMHIPHWAASCSIILSTRAFPALSRGHFIDATMAVWQYILVIYKRLICTFDLSTRGKYNNLLETNTLILQQNYQM